MAMTAHDAAGPHTRIPAYRRIRDEIFELIQRGTYRPHDRLPSETELIRRFGVSRVTIRLALGALRKDGIVQSMQGKGSFVCMPKFVQETPALLGFHEVMAGRGYKTVSRVVSSKERPASLEIAAALDLRRGSPVFEVTRLRCINDEPLSLDVSNFPLDVGAKLSLEDLDGDIFPLLESRCGVSLGRAEVTIEAVACDAACAKILGLAPGEPLLHLCRLTRTLSGRPVDYEHLYCRKDAWQYRVQLDRQRG
jgi:GntR family transcriptional regulator